METKIVKKEENEMVLQLEEERHTLPSLLCWALMQDDDVEEATYNLDHPMVGEPKIRVKAKDPQKALERAKEKIKKELDSLKLEEPDE